MPNFADNQLRDPLQGFDLLVSIESYLDAKNTGQNAIQAAFTSFMFKLINQTEAYLMLNSRIPRMLDGELIVVWSLEQGLIDLDFVTNLYGANFTAAYFSDNARSLQIPRTKRFKISVKPNISAQGVDEDGTATGGGEFADPLSDAVFRQVKQETVNAYNSKGLVTLNYCRIDTLTFGVTAGRHVAAHTMQGTAQSIGGVNKAITATTGG